jgi:predicted amidohydrolase
MRLILTQPALAAFDNDRSFEAVRRSMDAVPGGFATDDIFVLPEHAVFVDTVPAYVDVLAPLAQEAGCHVLGGSFHEIDGEVKRNTGALFAPDGSVMGWYDKLRPYADERARVNPGTRLGQFNVEGRNILVLICADFWFSDLFMQAGTQPDLVLVPALSVTRKPSPEFSRRLWRHLAISRAYEFGVYAGISDWAHDSALPRLMTSGVGGYADAAHAEPDRFYTPVPASGTLVVEPDFDALAQFRHDRTERGFYWKGGGE